MLEVQALTWRSAVEWLREGRRVVQATLVDVDGSAPLDLGASMVVDADLHVEGSVTGGCVESALVMEAEQIFGGGDARIARYGISDEIAGEVGLMCGGRVRIALAEVDPEDLGAMLAALEASELGQPAAVVTVLEGPLAGRRLAVTAERVVSAVGDDAPVLRSAVRDARAMLERGVSMTRRYASSGAVMGRDVEVFIQVLLPPPRLVVVGAVDFSAALAPIAAELGYRVTICDPRETFSASSRFRRGATVVRQWPDRYLSSLDLHARDAVLVFTHDAKLDEPALIAALESGAGFVGALGSRRTDRDRRRRLRDLGLPQSEIDRIVCPLGLDIGAATPGETAIAILAQLVTRRTGRTAEPLVATSGPIRAGAPRAGAHADQMRALDGLR